MSYVSGAALARMTLPWDHYFDQTALRSLTKEHKERAQQKHRESLKARKDVDPSVDKSWASSARRGSYQNQSTTLGGTHAWSKTRAAKKTYTMLRERYVEENQGRLSDSEMKMAEELYKAMAATVQRNLTRKSFATWSRPFLRFRGSQESDRKNPLQDRIFTLLDATGQNACMFSDFVAILSVFLKGTLDAQRFCTFHTLRLSGSQTNDQVDVITRDDLFRHIRLGTYDHNYFGPDVKLLLKLFNEKSEDDNTLTLEEFRDAGSHCAFKKLFTDMLHDIDGQAATKNAVEEDESDAIILLSNMHGLRPEPWLAKQPAKARDLADMFSCMDVDGDGFISVEDLQTGRVLEDSTAKTIIESYISDNSKPGLSFDDFARVLLNARGDK